jgi:hypothetical protein
MSPRPSIRRFPGGRPAGSAVAALVALAGALGAAEPPPERPFAMGFTPFPFDATPEAVAATSAFISRNGDLVVHHFDNGIPWVEVLEDRPLPPAVAADWAGRKETSRGKRIFLALTPLDGGRKDLALSRNEKENVPLPPSFAGKALDDPAVKKAYLTWCRRAVDLFRPDWLAIGIEVNELLLNAPGRWPAFRALYRETRAALKERWPDLPIGATVTLHALADPSKRDRNGQLAAVREFLAENDFVGVSYYPFMMGNMTRPEDPLDGLLPSLAPGKPIGIAETGFPAETLTLESFRLTLPSSPELQTAFLEKLLDRARRDRYLFVGYFLHRDYDLLWEKLKVSAPEFFKAWKDCGLLDGEGKDRPALGIWKKHFSAPLGERRKP